MTAIAKTALTGTRSRFVIFRHMRHPGTAPSRENANIIRDADVTDAIVQKSCATHSMKRSNSAHFRLIEFSQMYGTAFDTAPSVPLTSGIAKVTATSRMKPKTTETTTDMIIPQAAPSDALRVSSLMCAEASKPVIVYCAMRSPVPKTNQNTMLPQPEPEKPELLSVLPKTKPND